MGIILGQVIVTNVMFQMARLPGYKGSQANHGMRNLSDNSIDRLSIGSVLGYRRMPCIMAVGRIMKDNNNTKMAKQKLELVFWRLPWHHEDKE